MNKITKMEQMNKAEFRKFCIRALKKMDFHRVRVLNDDDSQCGIDIIATRGGVSYGIRCAVGQKAVGNAAVQDAYQGSRCFGVDVPVVLGNNAFSEDAVKLADRRKAELWDGREMLAEAFQKYCEKQDRKIAGEKAWEEEVDRDIQRLINGADDVKVSAAEATPAFASYSAAPVMDPFDEEPDFDPDSYVPDDFEPDLDPYDRQALYDEEVIDDLVLSRGGDPFDFEDRMDALSDPFGFDGDGDL